MADPLKVASVGGVVRARRQCIRINSDLAGSEIMRKTQTHWPWPATSRAADGGVSRVWSVMAESVETTGWLYGQRLVCKCPRGLVGR